VYELLTDQYRDELVVTKLLTGLDVTPALDWVAAATVSFPGFGPMERIVRWRVSRPFRIHDALLRKSIS